MTFVKRKQIQLFFLSNHHTSLVKLSKQEQVLLVEFASPEPPEIFLPSPPPEGEFFVLSPFTELSNFTRKIAAVWFTPKYSRFSEGKEAFSNGQSKEQLLRNGQRKSNNVTAKKSICFEENLWFSQAEGQADMFRSSGSRNSAHRKLQV